MLEKLNQLKSWQVAIIIFVLGFLVFFNGLHNPFLGYDDKDQIVNNTLVHSISNLPKFFEGGNYGGLDSTHLVGFYYRPLMTVTYSLIYTVFGEQAFYFHLAQLLIYIAGVIVLYLVFRQIFSVTLALPLSLLFLVHPINSRGVYAIQALQDVLFFLFGVLAILVLMRFRSARSLIGVALLIFLSLLSKEAGVVFIALTLSYLFLFDRKRIVKFILIIAPFVIAYLVLKANATGLYNNTALGPIDTLSLGQRMLTMPSILAFYLYKFIYPLELSSGYYWVYKSFSAQYVLVPLAVNLALVVIAVYFGRIIRAKLDRKYYKYYLFFALWFAIGILPYMQVIPLHFTANETWFSMAMAGLFGMAGIVLMAYQKHITPRTFFIAILILGALLGVRTGLRAHDWSSSYNLALSDNKTAQSNFNSQYILALKLNSEDNFSQALPHAKNCVKTFPSYRCYLMLGMTNLGMNDYTDAYTALTQAQKYQNSQQIKYYIGATMMWYGDKYSDDQEFNNLLKDQPNDTNLLFYKAVMLYRNDDRQAAIKTLQPVQYLGAYQHYYELMINSQPLNISFNLTPTYDIQ